MTRTSKAMLFMLLAAVSVSASAFRSLTTEGFTDPDFRGYMFHKAVLMVQNADNEGRTQIEERLTDDLKKHGVEVITYRNLFPPTREWTAETRDVILQREHVDAALIVTVGSSASSVIPVATQTFSSGTANGTVNTYGNSATVHASGYSNSTTYNVLSAHSKSEFSAVLIDMATHKTAWYADISTKAAGTLFVSEKGDAKAAVKGVMEGLEKEGHLPTK